MSVYDVVVAGGGNAGLCAALAARDEGARVLVLERSPKWRRGGNSRHTRDIRYAHEKADVWAADPYPESEFLRDLDMVSAPARPDLADLMVKESRSLPEWMEQHGVRWQGAIHRTLGLRTNRFFLGGGKAMLNAYYSAAHDRGIDIIYDAFVANVLIGNGRCKGVSVEHQGKAQVVEARAVVIASGGLEANQQWLERVWGSGAKNFVIRGTPDNDGRLLLSLKEHGAASAGSDRFHCIAVDARSPRFDGGIVTRVDSIPFSVVLNKNGRRFYDEGEDVWPKRYAQWGELIATQPDQIAYSIFDSRSWGLFIPPLYAPTQRESLEALLVTCGVNVPQGLETIRRFNEAVDESRAFDSSQLDGRAARGVTPARSNWARTIAQPPFLAYPLRPGLTFTYACVAINETARVLQEDGSAFSNVFGAGEAIAGNILTRGYLAGVGLTIGSVFGRIAGKEAARV